MSRISGLRFYLPPRPSLSPGPGPRVTAQIQGMARAGGYGHQKWVGGFSANSVPVPTGSGPSSNTPVPSVTPPCCHRGLLVPPPAFGTLCRLVQAASHPGRDAPKARRVLGTRLRWDSRRPETTETGVGILFSERGLRIRSCQSLGQESGKRVPGSLGSPGRGHLLISAL